MKYSVTIVSVGMAWMKLTIYHASARPQMDPLSLIEIWGTLLLTWNVLNIFRIKSRKLSGTPYGSGLNPSFTLFLSGTRYRLFVCIDLVWIIVPNFIWLYCTCTHSALFWIVFWNTSLMINACWNIYLMILAYWNPYLMIMTYLNVSLMILAYWNIYFMNMA